MHVLCLVSLEMCSYKVQLFSVIIQVSWLMCHYTGIIASCYTSTVIIVQLNMYIGLVSLSVYMFRGVVSYIAWFIMHLQVPSFCGIIRNHCLVKQCKIEGLFYLVWLSFIIHVP